MKRSIIFVMILAMTLCLFAGCKSANNEDEAALTDGMITENSQNNEGPSASTGDNTLPNNSGTGSNGPQKVEDKVTYSSDYDTSLGANQNLNSNTNAGNTNTGNINTGNTNTGNTNTGNTNTGNTNTGNTNPGDTNTDDTNTGDTNPGDTNTGDTNTGDTNTGDANIGDTNPGDTTTGDTNTGDTNTGDTNTGEEFEGDETPEIDPEAEDSGYFKILSYNLRGLRFGPTVNGQSTDVVRKEDVAAAIREIDADFVGLQELELNRDRSGNFDHVPWLAEQCGYKYFHFTQTVFDNNGTSGEGHGILSKYPIKDVKDVWYDQQDGEKRKYCRAVLDVNGKDVVFYNTHLCTDNPSDVNSVSASQFKQVLRAFYNEKGPTLLTADFNIVKETRAKIVDYSKGVIGLDGGPDRCFFNSNLHIDDIYVRNLEVYSNPKDEMCIFTGEDMMGTVEITDLRPSDHIPLWGYVKFKGQ